MVSVLCTVIYAKIILLYRKQEHVSLTLVWVFCCQCLVKLNCCKIYIIFLSPVELDVIVVQELLCL